jgi:multidrug efflux pump
MGVAVFSGMLGVTFFGLLFTPLFYVLVRGLVERKRATTVRAPDNVYPIHTIDRQLAVGEGD